MSDKEHSAGDVNRTLWWERVIGFIAGAVLGLVIGVCLAVFLVLCGFSFWMLLLCPLASVGLLAVLGALFPRPVIESFEHTSVLGKPLLEWFT